MSPPYFDVVDSKYAIRNSISQTQLEIWHFENQVKIRLVADAAGSVAQSHVLTNEYIYPQVGNASGGLKAM